MRPTRAVLLAAAAALVPSLLGACGGANCWRIGYEKPGTPTEEGRAVLAAAMQDAAERYPIAPPPPGDEAAAAAANAAVGARIESVDAAMKSAGYTRVQVPVDCETGRAK